MIVLHAVRGFESRTRNFTTQRAAVIYATNCARYGWIVKSLTVQPA